MKEQRTTANTESTSNHDKKRDELPKLPAPESMSSKEGNERTAKRRVSTLNGQDLLGRAKMVRKRTDAASFSDTLLPPLVPRDSKLRHRRTSAIHGHGSITPDSRSSSRQNKRSFKWLCRVTKVFCRMAMEMTQNSIQKTAQTTVSQMHYINIKGAADSSQSLFFDKSLFSRKRASAHVPLWVQAITVKPIEERTDEDITHLNRVVSNMKSFREKFTETMRVKMCSVMRYTRCDQGRVVLRQGHAGQDFYFIYSGSVFVQIELVDPKTGEKVPSTENVIRSGESFGEIALLGDGKRTASIICREPTELFQIDKETFLKVCPDIFNKELEEKTTFAEQFELFQSWDRNVLRKLCFMSQVLYIPHGKIIEVDSSKSNFTYFVMQGRISLLREIDISEVLDRTDVNLRGMMDRKLDVPDSYRKDSSNSSKRWAAVGNIPKNQCSELRVLSTDVTLSLPRLILISEGAKVLRIAKRIFGWMAPRKASEDYLKKRFKPFTIPPDEAICRKMVYETHWKQFRTNVRETLFIEKNKGRLIHVSTRQKGSSGWAKWPGYAKDCTTSSLRLSMIKPKVNESLEEGTEYEDYDDDYYYDDEVEEEEFVEIDEVKDANKSIQMDCTGAFPRKPVKNDRLFVRKPQMHRRELSRKKMEPEPLRKSTVLSFRVGSRSPSRMRTRSGFATSPIGSGTVRKVSANSGRSSRRISVNNSASRTDNIPASNRRRKLTVVHNDPVPMDRLTISQGERSTERSVSVNS